MDAEVECPRCRLDRIKFKKSGHKFFPAYFTKRNSALRKPKTIMKQSHRTLIFIICFAVLPVIFSAAPLHAHALRDSTSAQDFSAIVVAVLDFKNNSGIFSLDDLEKSVPEMLKTEISRRGSKLSVVERQKLETILREQALAQSGVLDEKSGQAVGQLLGAQYLLTGEINRSDSRLRIDCHILKVSTGQVRGEKVIGRDRAVIDEMVSLLAANIFFNLSGEGQYSQRRQLKSYPLSWFLAATAVSAAATGATYWVSHDAYEKYQNASRLDDIDKYYNRAENFRKVRNGLAIASGVMAITTAVLWMKNRSDDNQLFATTDYPEKKITKKIDFVADHQGAQIRLCVSF
jgi:TolB-like protein